MVSVRDLSAHISSVSLSSKQINELLVVCGLYSEQWSATLLEEALVRERTKLDLFNNDNNNNNNNNNSVSNFVNQADLYPVLNQQKKKFANKIMGLNLLIRLMNRKCKLAVTHMPLMIC